MTSWETVTIGQLGRVVTGATPRTGDDTAWGDQVDFITPTEMSYSDRDPSGCRRLSGEGLATMQRKLVPAKSVLFACIGFSTGKVARISRPAVTNQQVNTLVPDPAVVDSGFAYYLLRSRAANIRHIASGSTTPIVNKSTFEAFSVSVPNLLEQAAIAGVLGTLDDKIAVSKRIASTALRIADVNFTRASRGLAFGPATFGSVATVVGGGTPSTKIGEYWGGKLAWATPTDVTALSSPYLFQTGRMITAEGLENCASQLYPEQSILMTSRATIGAFALPQVPVAVNQGFIVVLPRTEKLRWWLLHEMRSRVDEMVSLANGSTFLELSRKNFKAMSIRLPGDEFIAEFARTVSPLHERAAQATAESRALAALRDTLLPQLMSGKLRVRDAERIVEDAV
ncbi:restriction endonuclease subunit S [Streptomyces sp. NPDC001552]|uniref:restriction endonuclease subunit S n=1 Tax=Streptomyces sp. NPDC001552 TaxID=3364587 RepID=UPI0036836AD5